MVSVNAHKHGRAALLDGLKGPRIQVQHDSNTPSGAGRPIRGTTPCILQLKLRFSITASLMARVACMTVALC